MRKLWLCATVLAAIGGSAFGGIDAEADDQPVIRDFAPDISPDGRLIAFYSYRTEKKPDLYLFDIASGTETRLTETPEIWEIEPHWSPDGTRLFYGGGASMRALRPHIYDLASGAHSIQGNIDKNIGPADWLPDGRSLVFFERGGLLGSDRLAVLGADGTITGMEGTLPEGRNSNPHMSPDGGHVLFQNEHHGNYELYVFNIDTGEAWRLTENDIKEEYLGWSRGGSWITYSAKADDLPSRIYGIQIAVEEQKGAPPQRLSQGPEDQVHIFSSVSDDGAWLYYDANVGQSFRLFRQSLADLSAAPEQLTGLE